MEHKLLWKALAVWLAAVNAVDFALMGWDKRQAKRGGWRVRERTFFLWALAGGAPGAILGMRTFRHKTKHWYFQWGLPAILAAQIAAAGWLILR